MHRLLALAPLMLACASSHLDELGEERFVESPTLFIPMRPQTSLVADLWFDAPDAEGAPVTVDQRLVFAEGARYPDTLDIELAGFWLLRCAHTGRYVIDSVESGSDGVVAIRTGDASFRVTARPGSADTSVVVRGSFESERPFSCASWARGEQRVVDFEIVYSVASHAVGGLLIERPLACHGAEGLRYFWGNLIESVQYLPTDASGARMSPDNALPSHPVDLTLRTRDGSNLRGGEFLTKVQLPMSTTVVDVSAPAGEPVAIDVLDPGVLSEVDYRFRLVGGARDDVPLVSGQRLDGLALEEMTNFIVGNLEPGAWEENLVCAPPSHRLFELRSATPTVCQIVEVTGYARYLGPAVVGNARLERDGECQLTWSAPALNGGRGLGGELSFMAVNVDSLVDY